jgi:hypothetical protein
MTNEPAEMIDATLPYFPRCLFGHSIFLHYEMMSALAKFARSL